jgi:long-chain acyl-CoA synthetase
VSISDHIQRSSSRVPHKTALICGEQRLTYSDLERASDRLALALGARGVSKGDRVCILLPNGAEAVIAILACMKAGAVFVVASYATRAERLSYILSDCRPTVVITDEKAAERAIGYRRTLPSPSENPEVIIAGQYDATEFSSARQVHCFASDLACIIYTSGSTARPKGVMCEHGSMEFVARSVISYLENTEDDVILSVLPLSFSYGLYQALMAFMLGATLVLEPHFGYPVTLLQRIQAERVTGLPAVPTMLISLLQLDFEGYDLTSLRYITNAAAALPVAHARRLRDVLPYVRIYSMYGQTETKRSLYLPPDQIDRRPDSVGIAIPGTEAWIEDEHGARLGPGEAGELVVRGRHVMRGYWQDPEATAERFSAGRYSGERVFRSGDLFRMDHEGYLYFIGRKDDIIKTRGEKVAPKEVEMLLHAIPGVREAAVVGVPDPVMGEAVKAFIVADRSCVTMSRILAHCRAHLQEFMVPKYVEFRDQLPRTESGKVFHRGCV